jgi:hypothetical protein
MRLMTPFLVALALTSCAGDPERKAPEAKPFWMVTTKAPEPVVSVRIRTIRSWSDPFFIVSEEDQDFTLSQAVAFGLPEKLWIVLAQRDPRFRWVVYWVRPLRA